MSMFICDYLAIGFLEVKHLPISDQTVWDMLEYFKNAVNETPKKTTWCYRMIWMWVLSKLHYIVLLVWVETYFSVEITN